MDFLKYFVNLNVDFSDILFGPLFGIFSSVLEKFIKFIWYVIFLCFVVGPSALIKYGAPGVRGKQKYERSCPPPVNNEIAARY